MGQEVSYQAEAASELGCARVPCVGAERLPPTGLGGDVWRIGWVCGHGAAIRGASSALARKRGGGEIREASRSVSLLSHRCKRRHRGGVGARAARRRHCVRSRRRLGWLARQAARAAGALALVACGTHQSRPSLRFRRRPAGRRGWEEGARVGACRGPLGATCTISIRVTGPG